MPETKPLVDFRFKVQLGDGDAAFFNRISAMSVSIESILYREGGGEPHVRKLPGRTAYGDVEFEYGVGISENMWDWLMQTAGGQCERRNLTVIMLSPDGSPGFSLNLNNSWVRECRFAALDALSNRVLIQTMVVAVESLTKG